MRLASALVTIAYSQNRTKTVQFIQRLYLKNRPSLPTCIVCPLHIKDVHG